MAATPYITPEEVKDYTGAQARWFDLAGEAELLATLREWIGHAEDLVTRFIGAKYDASAGENDLEVRPRLVAAAPPYGVKNAVMRITANMVAQAKLRRSTVVLQLDEYTQRLVDDRIFTRAVKEDLAMYQFSDPSGSYAGGASRGMSGSIGVSGMISRERLHREPETFGDIHKDLTLTSTKRDVIRYWYEEPVYNLLSNPFGTAERRV